MRSSSSHFLRRVCLVPNIHFNLSHLIFLLTFATSVNKKPRHITKIAGQTVPLLIKGVLPDTSLMMFGQLVPTNPSSEGWTRPAGRLCPCIAHCFYWSRSIVPTSGVWLCQLPSMNNLSSTLPFAPCTSRQPLALSVMLSRASRVAKWTWPWATNASWCRDGILKSTELRRERGAGLHS